MAQTSNLRDQWAIKGAVARINEINAELQAIYHEFPELKGSKRAAASGTVGEPAVSKKKRTMSPEARKRMSAGMRKFWARRKSAAKQKSAQS